MRAPLWPGRLLWLGLLLILGGCATNPPLAPLPDTLPPAAAVTGLPFYPQLDDQCGPASLATVLAHSGIRTNPDALRPRVYLPGRRGSLATEMVAQARQHRRLVYPLQAGLADLLQELAAGNPVLVLQNLRFDWWPQWHFAVVTGYDLERRELILRSGLERRYRVGFDLFRRTWVRARYWAVVISHPAQLAATAQPLPALQAAADLEEVGLADAASAAYEAVARRWPAQPLAHFALGNLAYGDGNFRSADDHYRAALAAAGASDGQRARSWNNRAYALRALGCPRDAQSAARCAVELGGGADGFRDTLAEMAAAPGPAASAPAECPELQVGACR